MNLEETIQTCFDKHAPSFENRKQVLIYLFCLFGTGFEWKNGELVETIENWGTFEGTLDEKGKSRQLLSIEDVALKITYEGIIKDEGLKKPIPYEQFLIRMNDVKVKLAFKGMTLEDTFLKERVDIIKLLRASHEKYIKERMCRKYSPIFNVPKDIKEDWLKGVNEVKEIIKELNVCLDEIQ